MIYINQNEHNLYKTLGDVLEESNKKYERYSKTQYEDTNNDKDFDNLRNITNDKFKVYKTKFKQKILGKSSFRSKKTKFSNFAKDIMLTNSTLNNLNFYNTNYERRTISYDPYLMKVCKKAIVNVKDQLPNYKEIIHKINLEFDIPDSINNNIINNYNDIIENKNLPQNESTYIPQQSNIFTKNSSTAETGINVISERNKSTM